MVIAIRGLDIMAEAYGSRLLVQPDAHSEMEGTPLTDFALKPDAAPHHPNQL